jgi:hypothetical protein
LCNKRGPKGNEVTGDWRKLPNKELHNLYCSPNIIRMIKSRRMGGHVVRIGEVIDACKILVGKPERKRTDCGLNSPRSGYGSLVGFCEHGNELKGSMKGWEYLEQPSNSQLPKKDSAPWS